MSSTRTSIARSEAIVPSRVLGMALFIATEALFFAGLISAFVVLRAQAVDWPPAGQPRLPIGVTGFNTLILLASAWTMQQAAAALRRGEPQVRRRLLITAALGAFFVGIQGYEWVNLVRYGLTTGSSLYGATFYTIVGAHGLHVLAAVISLIAAALIAPARSQEGTDLTWLDPFRMYWFFVAGVWPVLYVLVYLS